MTQALEPRIQPMSEEHLEKCHSLNFQLGYQTTLAEFAHRYHLISNRSDHMLCVALIADQVVGWMHLQEKLVLESDNAVQVSAIVVDERMRRCGVGQMLLMHAEVWAKTRGYKSIFLSSNVTREDAHTFYERLGYASKKQSKIFAKNFTSGNVDELGRIIATRNLKSQLQTIGHISCTRKRASDDHWNEESSSIELNPDIFSSDALEGLSEFSHIEVVFFMDQVRDSEKQYGSRHPRDDSKYPRTGVFAQRGRNRPNPIGLSVCKVISIEGLRILIEDCDAIDGTPVLDIKPFVTAFGPKGKVREPEWIIDLMKNYWKGK